VPASVRVESGQAALARSVLRAPASFEFFPPWLESGSGDSPFLGFYRQPRRLRTFFSRTLNGSHATGHALAN
jgi:hypothetical protein